jgi:hypothetical protein
VNPLPSAVILAALSAFACNNDPPVGDLQVPAPVPDAGEVAVCSPDALCVGCATCFDQCLCGGGDTAVCAEHCGSVEPPAASDAGRADAAPLPPMVATLVMDPFEIAPGEEIFKCQNFGNPFGQNAVVLSTESFMTAGSHHMFVFQLADEGPGELEDCSGLEFGANLHLAQKSQQKTTYPPGIGRLLTWMEGLRLQVHYFNA